MDITRMEKKIKVYMIEDEAWPVLYVRPKEQAYNEKDLRDIPIGLIDKYKAVEEEYKSVQKALRKYWEEK